MAKRKATSRSAKPKRVSRGGQGPVVLVLPGILGSELDDKRGDAGSIWIDPFGVIKGELALLRVAANGTDDADASVHIEATDVVHLYYEEIKKKLKKQGFDARYHPFDWRHSIADLAAELADYIVQEVPNDRQLSLVAHSMGGLVSRTLFAAHAQVAARVNRLIMLGTPNFGSFSPVQVFSGNDTMFRVVAGLDFVNSARVLNETFASFPGLVAMLPNPAKVAQPNFLEPGTWPADVLTAAALRRARAQQLKLDEDLDARNRYSLIAGIGRATVCSAKMIEAGKFDFTDGDGDGTVPLDLCLLPDVGQLYFTDAKHGAMPTDNEVIDAVIDILQRGEAKLPKSVRLHTQRAPQPHRSRDIEIPGYVVRAKARSRLRSQAGREKAAERFVARLTPKQRLEIRNLTHDAASDFIDLPTHDKKGKLVAAKKAEAPASERLPRRLLIKTVLGSITAAPSSTLVMGVYPSVRPQGSLAALDKVVQGYVTRLFEQGAIHGGAGEVMFLPTPGAAMPAELAVLVGLGEPRSFGAETLQRVGENLARALMQVHVHEIATVAIGSGNLPLSSTLGALLRGLLVGLTETDPDAVFRAITICEANAKRLAEIRKILSESLEYWRERGVELEIKELGDLPLPDMPARRYSDLAYWIETLPDGLRFFLMGSAANIEERISTSTKELAASVVALQAAMESDRTSDARKAAQLRQFGARLARLVPKEFLAPIAKRPSFDQARLDLAESAAMVPWELLRVGDKAASLHLPMVRRLGISADHRPAANYMMPDQRDGKIRIAIVADPTDDLPGARREGEALVENLGKNRAFEVTSFIGSRECSERGVHALIDAGAVDVLHYAGHGCFNPDRPETSGLFINGETDGMLTAAEIRSARRPPLLIFTNACQVGIVPPRPGEKWKKADRHVRAQQPYGFAEALLQIGVRAYLGTFWSIPDDAALAFALGFYGSLSSGESLGEAILKSRQKIQRMDETGVWAWASYMLYGPAWFRLVGK